MRAEQKWCEFAPKHFVAMYSVLYAEVYGSEDAEMGTKTFFGALNAAKKMLAKEFEGNSSRMVSYVGWCWKEAASYVYKQREAGDDVRWLMTWKAIYLNRRWYTMWRTQQVLKAARR